MKILVLIPFLLASLSLTAQGQWISDPTSARLYSQVKERLGVLLIPGYVFEETIDWKEVDSLFQKMPLSVARELYHDSSHSIRFYSFIKILGSSDVEAFRLLPHWLSDSTIIHYFTDDSGGEIPFNQLLASSYEDFITSKYYWCDTKGFNARHYFRDRNFSFTKKNYGHWPKVLTAFLNLIQPWSISHRHNIQDLKHYTGLKNFHGR